MPYFLANVFRATEITLLLYILLTVMTRRVIAVDLLQFAHEWECERTGNMSYIQMSMSKCNLSGNKVYEQFIAHRYCQRIIVIWSVRIKSRIQPCIQCRLMFCHLYRNILSVIRSKFANSS